VSSAQDDYGVVLTPELDHVEEDATAALRMRLRADRGQESRPVPG
jgi:hypothetical protein